jgi:hypothetical protein
MPWNTPQGQVQLALLYQAVHLLFWLGEQHCITYGYGYSTHPIGRVGEKFLAWTDEDPSIDTILESLTLYWVTDSFASTLYPYRQVGQPVAGRHGATGT